MTSLVVVLAAARVAHAQMDEPTTHVVIKTATNPALVLEDLRDVVDTEGHRTRRWVAVCSAPCGAELPVTSLYRIVGSGVSASKGFHLPADASRVWLEVEPGSRDGRTTGIVLASTGGGVVVLGGLLFFYGAVSHNPDSSPSDEDRRKVLQTVGAVLAATGAVALFVGVVLMVNNRTDVVVQSARAASTSSAAGPFELTPLGLRF